MWKSTLILAVSALLGACGGSSSNDQPASSSSSASSSSMSSASSSSVDDDFEINVSSLIPAQPEPTPTDRIPEGNNTYYVAAEASSDNFDGSEENPFASLQHAADLAEPGDVIVVRGGEYRQTERIQIRASSDGTGSSHGTEEAPIIVINYPGEEPVFDFEGQELGNHGFRLDTNYWHVIGLTIKNAGHNGFGLEGNHNRVERLVITGSKDTGLHVGGLAAHNLIMNCDSYRNFNDTRDPIGNRADGFAAKGDRIGEGNLFYGNRAWENSDDGFDFWEAENTVTLYNNWSFGNGNPDVFGNPEDFQGGGNGFKLGRSERNTGNHVVYRNMAFDNRFGNAAKGFDQNSNAGRILLAHNTAYNNGRNFVFGTRTGNHLWNNVSLEGDNQIATETEGENNSWQLDDTVTVDALLSVDTEAAKGPREADGSLPDIDLLRSRPDSVLVDAGAKLALDYEGEAPDIGHYEH